MSKSYCVCCGRQQKGPDEDNLYTCQRGHLGPIGVTEKENARLAKRREKNSIYNSVNIDLQIGDDEVEHPDLYYRLTGSHGDFALKTFKRSKTYNGVDEKWETREVTEKRYYGNLFHVVRKIQTMELSNAQAATLPELLEVLIKINNNIESLEDALFELSTEED